MELQPKQKYTHVLQVYVSHLILAVPKLGVQSGRLPLPRLLLLSLCVTCLTQLLHLIWNKIVQLFSSVRVMLNKSGIKEGLQRIKNCDPWVKTKKTYITHHS